MEKESKQPVRRAILDKGKPNSVEVEIIHETTHFAVIELPDGFRDQVMNHRLTPLP